MRRKKCISVFGAGRIGEIVIQYLKDHNIEVKACYDNNPAKWSHLIQGVRIDKPKTNWDLDEIVLVAVERDSKDIVEGLCS